MFPSSEKFKFDNKKKREHVETDVLIWFSTDVNCLFKLPVRRVYSFATSNVRKSLLKIVSTKIFKSTKIYFQYQISNTFLSSKNPQKFHKSSKHQKTNFLSIIREIFFSYVYLLLNFTEASMLIHLHFLSYFSLKKCDVSLCFRHSTHFTYFDTHTRRTHEDVEITENDAVITMK